MSNLSLNHDIIQNLEEIFEYKVYVLDGISPPIVILPTRASLVPETRIEICKRKKNINACFLSTEQIIYIVNMEEQYNKRKTDRLVDNIVTAKILKALVSLWK